MAVSQEIQTQRKKNGATFLGSLFLGIPILGDVIATIACLKGVGAILVQSENRLIDLLVNFLFLALFYAALVGAIYIGAFFYDDNDIHWQAIVFVGIPLRAFIFARWSEYINKRVSI